MSQDDQDDDAMPSAADVAARRAEEMSRAYADAEPEVEAAPAQDAQGEAESDDPYARYRNLPAPSAEELLELRRLADEAAVYLDSLKRSKADFANLQKRTLRESAKTRELARRDMVINFIDAIDEFRLIMEKSQTYNDFETVMNALGIFAGKLNGAMERTGLTMIDARGKPFDPDQHEAMMQLDNAEVEPGTVLEQVRPGYKLGDMLVRPAQVVVAKKPGSNG